MVGKRIKSWLIMFMTIIFIFTSQPIYAFENGLKPENAKVTVVKPAFKESQIETRFPEKEQSDALLTRYRSVFKGYKGKGSITVENHGAKTAEIYVNGHRVSVDKALKNTKGKANIDIGSYTQNGDNLIKVLNISPKDAYIDIKIPYPELSYGKPNEVGFSEEKLSLVDSFIEQEVEKGFPGAALIVVKDGRIIKNTSYGYKKIWEGDTRLEVPEKMSPDTMFDLASNTKMFSTNLALQRLVSEGKLNVEDYVVKYLPDFKDRPQDAIKGKEKIKVEDLLNHCAGFTPDIHYFNPDKAKELYSQDRPTTLKMLCRTPLAYTPGSKVLYSDVDYLLLGYIIEKITGVQQDKYVEDTIYKPLGLHHTMYNPLQKGYAKEDCAATERNGNTRDHTISFPNIREYTLQGEVHDEKAFYSMAGVAGHAGLFSNTHDMAVLAQLLLNGGGYGGFKLFDRNTLDMFTKQSDIDVTYGLGWDRAANGFDNKTGESLKTWQFGPYASNTTVGHTGWTGTVTSVDFKNDMAVILLTNKKHSPIPNPVKSPNTFEGDAFETGRYGSIVSMVYEALLENQKNDRGELDYKKVVDPENKGGNQLINGRFPELNPTSRINARYRRSFKAYDGRGTMTIENHGASSLELYINGKALKVEELLKSSDGKTTIDIGKYTVNGVNSLKVLNVLPAGSYINVSIPYPELVFEKKEALSSMGKFEEIDELINSEIKYGFPGAQLVVIKDGKVIKNTGYGYNKKYDGDKLLENPEKITENTLFDISNLTDVLVTNFAIQSLVSEGKIKLEAEVSKHLPDFKDSEGDKVQGKSGVKVKDLLNHTAGFDEDYKFYLPESGDMNSRDRETTIKNLLRVPLSRKPGEKSIYSSLDYMLLGLIVEKVTGQRQDEYLEEKLYKPLGLKNTLYNPLKKGFKPEEIAATGILGNTMGGKIDFPGIRKSTIQGEVYDENTFYSMNGVSGNGGLFSTGLDVGVLAQSVLNYGGYSGIKLSNSDTIESFIKQSDYDKTLGLGWRRQADGGRREEFGAYGNITLVGYTAKTGAVITIDPRNDMAVVLLTNMVHSPYNKELQGYESKGFKLAKGGNIVSLVYEALLEKGRDNLSGLYQCAVDELGKSKSSMYSAAIVDVFVSRAEKSRTAEDIKRAEDLIEKMDDCEFKKAFEERLKKLLI